MLFVGALFSAVALLLGVLTKLPQGGGGLIGNLMVMSCFYSIPPLLPPPPPPKAIFLDLDASIFSIRQHCIRNPQSPGNITEGPKHSSLADTLAIPSSQIPPAQNSTSSLPGFSSPTFSPPLTFCQFYSMMAATLVRIAMVFFVLSLPWLAARQLYLVEMAVSARKAAGTPFIMVTGLEDRFWQIQPHNPLFDDLKIAISECDKALVELKQTTKNANEGRKKALERDHENDECIKGLRNERDNLLAELAKGERALNELQEENEDEFKVLKKEMTRQARAWEEKEREWTEKKEGAERRHQEEKNSLRMGRERESDSWRREVENLEAEKQRQKEHMGRRLKNVSEGMKKERERWVKETEGWKKEKDEDDKERQAVEAERSMTEGKANEEKRSWEKANDRAQRRIVELEDENTRLANEAADKEKLDNDRQAAINASEEASAEQQRLWEEALQLGVAKATSKLQEEVLNGRKLIEDLQTDKRRDRQLLLELRAQLVKPTHAVPPSHINPLRFGYGPPIVATSPAAPFAYFPARPIGALPTILPPPPPRSIPRPPPPPDAASQAGDGPPVIRLPPPPPPRGQ